MKKTHEVDIDVVPRAIASELIRRKSPSLRPGPSMMDACLTNQPEAIAIRDAWRFKQPVLVVSRNEYVAIIERGSVTFHAQ